MNINLTLIGQSVSMIVFVWLCMKFIWPPLLGVLEQRQKTIADGLAAAEDGKRELEKAHQRAEELLREAQGKATEIVDQAHKRASKVADDAKIEAVEERQRQLAAASNEINLETERAREALRTQVATLAVAGASRLLEREIDPAAHAALLDELVAEM